MGLIAERPVLWRLIALSALAAGALALTCERTHEEPKALRGSCTGGLTRIHVRYREGYVPAASSESRPLFPSVSAQTSHGPFDDRARWRIVWARGAVDSVLADLRADPSVEVAMIPPSPELPTVLPAPGGHVDTFDPSRAATGGDVDPFAPSRGGSCPITTPSYEAHQGYLGPAPHGIDAPAVWRRGARGQGVWFADVEGAWNTQHEDVPGSRMVHIGQPLDSPYYRMHGTAVVGEVVGLDNGRGVVGIAPDVDRVVTSSIGGISAAEAIDAAAEALRPGDVLLIELHAIGPRGRYLPMEFWDDCFDAIEAATSRGVIVIEAGGNGAENLDHRAYEGKLTRAVRDSGAILVGAGGPPRRGFSDRTRLDFSNYGSRVDVQGWGRMVATLDYGDLQSCDVSGGRHYTGEFSGTSSASPIVAGAAILLQSVAKATGRLLLPAEVSEVLRSTGSAQTGNTREWIGPRPDLARAVVELDRVLDRP